MAALDGDPVERAGMVAIFARWQLSAFELQYQSKIRDEAAKKADDSLASLNACREACKAFGVDPDNTEQLNQAFQAYGYEAAQIFNQTKPAHLPLWFVQAPAPAPEPATDQVEQAQISPPLENPPPPPMPRMKDAILEYLSFAHELELGGQKAADIRSFIETKYSTTFHEKTVGMTLYRLLKDGKVRRKGHIWFFVPQEAEAKNPGAPTPGLFEGR